MKRDKRAQNPFIKQRFEDQNGRCFYCNVELSTRTGTKAGEMYKGKPCYNHDHVVPRSRGGVDDWSNIVLACAKCNTQKSNRLPSPGELKRLEELKKNMPQTDSSIIFNEKNHTKAVRKYMDQDGLCYYCNDRISPAIGNQKGDNSRGLKQCRVIKTTNKGSWMHRVLACVDCAEDMGNIF